MLKTTIWRPDTCACTILYQWDDSVPDDQRVHTPVDKASDYEGNPLTNICCDDHAHLKDDYVAHHDALMAENQMKNIVLNKITDQNIDLTPGDVSCTFTKDINGDRILNVSVPKKAQATADKAVTDLVDQQFNGKVVLG